MGQTPRDRFILAVTVGYTVLGVAWILLSDRLLESVAGIGAPARLDTASGLLFVAATAALYFVCLRAVPAPPNEAADSLHQALAARMTSARLSGWPVYAFALALTLGTLGLREALPGVDGDRRILVLFMLPIFLSALMGGIGPGLVATAVACLGVNWMVLAPRGDLFITDPMDLLHWGVLLVSGAAVSLFSEVLRRSRAHREMQRRLLDAIVSGTSDGVFVKDALGRTALANTAAAGFMGQPPGTVVGRDGPDRVPAGPAPGITPHDQAVLESGSTRTVEERLAARDGREHLFLTTRGPIRDARGKVVGLFGIARDITERARTEATLRASEARFRRLFDELPLPMVRVNRDGDMVDRNRRFVELTGYDAAEVPTLAEWWVRAYPDPRHRSRAQEGWAAARARAAAGGGDIAPLENRITCRDGRRLDAVFAGIELDAGFVATLQDVTEERRSQAALRASEARSKSILDNAADAIYIVDREGRFVYANRQGGELLGYGIDEMCRMTLADVAPEEEGERIAAAFLELQARGRLNTEVVLKRKDGSRVPVEVNAILLPDGEAFGACRDITARRAAEAELERHRHHLEERVRERTAALEQVNDRLQATQFAMDSVGIAIHWLDPETGAFEYVNNAAATMLGYTVVEMLRLGIPDIDPAIPAGRFQEATAHLQGQAHVRFESTHRTRDGRLLPVEISAHLLEGRAGQRARVVAFVTDISARKAAEATLVRAKEAAEAATLAKSAFLANMSHEIRTPMNAILGLAHLLGRSGVTPRQARQLDQIASSGRHLLGILNDILDLSKIEAGRLELEKRDFALADVLQSALAVTGGAVAAKGLRMRVDIAGMPAALNGDPTRLSQALVNYLGNAAKFTQAGSVSLEARLLEETPEGYRVRFAVTDTGPGLAAGQRERLFDAFEQADNSTTRTHGGTGLGLAITRHLARLMGGEAGLDSVPGQGSTFWFTALLGRAGSPDGGAVPAAGPEAVERLRHLHGGARLLLAEDDAINQEVARLLLQDAGLEVDVARDGAEAVRMAATGAYELVLMDVQMPGMDGTAAARAIRAEAACSAVPIVALTANAFVEDRQRCLEAGMNDFVAKPVDPDTLYRALLRWLAPREPAGPGALPVRPRGPRV